MVRGGVHFSPYLFMYLYKQYCYSSLQEVKDSIDSDISFDSVSYLFSTEFNTDGFSLDLTYNNSGVLNTLIFTPPTCSRLGFDNSYTGITTLDATQLGSLVVAVFVAAYVIKILRRTF